MKPTIRKIRSNSRARSVIIDTTAKDLERNFRGLQNDLYRLVLNRIVKKLQIDENDRIINNERNRNLLANSRYVDKFLQGTAAGSIIDILNDSFDRLDRLAFDKASMFENVRRMKTSIQNKTKKALGLKPRGEEEGQFFALMRGDTSQANKIKGLINFGIRSQIAIDTFRGQISDMIRGNENKLGVIANFQKLTMQSQTATETYDRLIQDEYSKEIDLNYAIYQGGEIDTTRDFCDQRNGNVYTREEILDWQLLDWEGKKSPHNIIIDAGGYNCRHYYDWISYELAVQLRPDIPKSLFDRA